MRTRLSAVIILFSAAVLIWADPAVLPGTPIGWLEMLGSDTGLCLEVLGSGYMELRPEDYLSRAGHIYYYPEGLTLWSDEGKVVQLRLDKHWTGRAGRFRIGISPAELRQLMGDPWIEEELSLYYNLPWNGGPVRLRFLFADSVLDEIYLYNVR